MSTRKLIWRGGRCALLLSFISVANPAPVGAQTGIQSDALPTIVAPATDSSAPGGPSSLRPALLDPALSSLPDSTEQRAPAFPGGEAALLHFIRSRLRYPALAARNRVQGKVIVSFWIDERGRPYGFGVLKGLGAGLDEEALRILREMPDWTPAIVNGRPTLLQLRIPVAFRLAD